MTVDKLRKTNLDSPWMPSLIIYGDFKCELQEKIEGIINVKLENNFLNKKKN